MLAIIPARGGSKGLPGKNIKLLNGKPLIAYTIESALKSKYITKVIVSTDDDKIASIAKNNGAEIPFMRPDFLASDEANAIDVYQYTLNRLEKEGFGEIKDFIVLQPTSPLRKSIHIDDAIELFKTKQADSVISYCKEEHPIFWHKYIDKEGRFKDVFEGNFIKNRQTIRPTYYPNGAIYVFKKDLINQSKYFSEDSFAYIMDRESSIDIDSIEDFNYCEYILNKKII